MTWVPCLLPSSVTGAEKTNLSTSIKMDGIFSRHGTNQEHHLSTGDLLASLFCRHLF